MLDMCKHRATQAPPVTSSEANTSKLPVQTLASPVREGSSETLEFQVVAMAAVYITHSSTFHFLC